MKLLSGRMRRWVVMVSLALVGAVQAADKPLWKVKGDPTGEVVGGKVGTPFRDKARGRLKQVSVRGGSWLDSIRCAWDDEGTIEKGETHGGDGGDELVITLEPGESIVAVSGVIRGDDDEAVIGQLTVRTNKRTLPPIGKTTEGRKFTLEAPKGQEICGFQGRSSGFLHAVGMVCRPMPNP